MNPSIVVLSIEPRLQQNMLKLRSRSYAYPYIRKLERFVRLQSTSDQQHILEPINEKVELPLESSFSVFPRIQDVKSEDILGSGSFSRGKYFVGRSATGNLPVYSDFKAGGNKLVTEIRKIQGDIIQLRNDMQIELPKIPKDSWKIVMQSKKIIIKGDVVREVKKVLSQKF